ncbi:hypothetical protein H7992_07025 [Sporosarcina sp. resist]|uniref:hypothetical protein n=1 Tax=Sporosarcina sp. resist TaxID=2762563 RepID=UPI00164EC98B|nr:hypothetical protein [Sporosarcina sp. resist]QNK89412.1 hypothetical protein H7992_07025 [Sporosarcina sp. resist]
MKLNIKVLDEQLHTVRDFLFHYSSYRILLQNVEALLEKESCEFWVYTINAHYYQAINLWSMVFGTDSNEIHWKNIGLNPELGTLIISDLNLSEKEYYLYWKEITEWRNNSSAHRGPDFRRSTPTPGLETARNVIFVYEKWVNKHIDPSLEFSFKKVEEEYCKDVEKIINVF